MKVNDVGRIFTGNYDGDDVSVKAYDAPKGVPSWSYFFVPGTSINSLHPTPGGGIVALVQEPDMVSPGIPASPPTTSLKLIRVNANGIKTLPDITLPAEDTQGVVYEQTQVDVSVNNKIVVVRAMRIQTGLSWPETAPAVSISTIDT
jgi:hypothetical protein